MGGTDMRLTKTQQILNKRLSNTIRRSYPLIGSPSMQESYNQMTDPESPRNGLTQEPWIEALPKYEPFENGFAGLKTLLGAGQKDFVEFLEKMSDDGNGEIFPPYTHQADSLNAWANAKDFVVSTGTGSGKTECFLYPILGHLHEIASRRLEKVKVQEDELTSLRGMKAIVLYPMNALVGDQLKRMRTLFGNWELAEALSRKSLKQGGKNRFFQFGSYTGRTRFSGPYAYKTKQGSKNPKVGKSGSARKYVEKFVELETGGKTGPSAGKNSLYLQMMKKGLVPAKGKPKEIEIDGKMHQYWSLEEYLKGVEGDPLITQHEDRELLMRHEMHNVGYNFLLKKGEPRIDDTTNGGGTPDVMITNYSMLEYMLKRPLEHIMFHETRQWLEAEPENKLLLVLDEAHLYQGALGTEIGMLLRRLRMTLGIADQDDKVQFVLTSASLGTEELQKKEFVKGLTGRTEEWFEQEKTDFITGVKWELPESDDDLLNFDPQEWIDAFSSLSVDSDDLTIWAAAKEITGSPDEVDIEPETRKLWFDFLRNHKLYKKLYGFLGEKARSLTELSIELFGSSGPDEMKCSEIILNLLAGLTGETNIVKREDPLLGIRAHLLYRGLTEFYWNLSTDKIQSTSSSSIFSDEPEVIYPIYSCRRCGGGYAQVFIESETMTKGMSAKEQLLDGEAVSGRTYNTPYPSTAQFEVYLCDSYDGEITTKVLTSKSLIFPEKPDIFLHKNLMRFCTLSYFEAADKEEKENIQQFYKPGFLPKTGVNSDLNVDSVPTSFTDSGCEERYTFNKAKCRQCHSDHSRRQNDQITSLMTRGDQAFSSLSLGLHQSQDGDKPEDDVVLTPNRGKKVLIFSDGRQRAARMAKTIQDFANNDELRVSILHLLNDDWYKELTDTFHLRSLERLYDFYVVHITAAMQDPFEESASYFSPREMFANNREAILARHISGLGYIKREAKIEINALELEENKYLDDFISQFDDMSSTNTHLAWSEQFIAPTNTNMSTDLDPYLAHFNKKSGWDLLKYIRKNIMFKHLLRDSENDSSLNELGIILKYLSESFSSGDTSLPALEKDKLVQRYKDAAIGRTTDANIDPLIERWNTLRPANGAQVTDKDLQEFFQEKDKKFKKNKPYLIKKRNYVNSVLRWVLENLQPVSKYDEMVQKTLNLLRTDYNSLQDYAKLALQIQKVELDYVGTSNADLQSFSEYIFQKISGYLSSGAATPQFFFTQLIDFIASRDFSLEDLGLGRMTIEPEGYNHMIDDSIKKFKLAKSNTEGDQGKALKVLYEAIARFPIISHQNYKLNESGKDSSRGIKDRFSNFTVYAARDHPREYKLKKDSTVWGATKPQIEKYLTQVLEITKPPFDKLGFTPSNLGFAVTSNHTLETSGDGRYQTKAESVRLENLCGETENILMCTRCGSTLMHPLDLYLKRCNKCGANTEKDILPYDATDPLIKLRIEDPWRKPAQTAMNSPTENMEITLVRAEEHTAQINDPTSLDVMYSHAERFEMLFQDLPLVTPNDNNPFSPPEAPIDILSCTTTMEVGIDIGSLTAVALRTVPRERANYQQRVGRAGRGKSEVCVALSWYDNKPYAQHYFANPSKIIDHPDDSPIIYLENLVIIQRHIWAAIMQRFFKRLKFDMKERVFYGMDTDQQKAGLMDSMGTKDDFMENIASSETLYCRESLQKWIEDDDTDICVITKDGTPEDVRHFSWNDSLAELSALLPEGLSALVELNHGDDSGKMAKNNNQVIEDWAKDLLSKFDKISIGYAGVEAHD
jgi:Lhr-like helicase